MLTSANSKYDSKAPSHCSPSTKSGRMTDLASAIASKFKLYSSSSSSSSSSRDMFSMRNIERTRQDVIRNQMVGLIQSRLERGTCKHDKDMHNSSSSMDTLKLAKALENHLYKRSPTFKAYADKSTLNTRLRVVTTAVLKRRLSKKSKSQTHAQMVGSRPIAIRKIVGDSTKYANICHLANQVRSLRLQHCEKACGSCQMGVCSINRNQEHLIRAGTKVPKAVRDLFFDTPILVALEKTPLNLIPELDWDELIKSTVQIMNAYQEWSSS